MKKIQLLTLLFAFIAISQSFGQLTQGTILKTNDFTVTVYAKPDAVVPGGTSIGMLVAVSIGANGETNPANAPVLTGSGSVTGASYFIGAVEIINDRFVYPIGIEGTMTNGFMANVDNPLGSINFPMSLAGEIVQLNDFTGSGTNACYFYVTYNSTDFTNYAELFYGTNPVNVEGGDSWVEANAPLPLNLVSFNAKKSGERDAYLSWTTANEENTSRFVVQRSYDKNSWTEIGTVGAAGYSVDIRNYELFDANVNSGRTNRLQVYYRLKMIDLDGQYKHSPIQSVVFNNGTSTKVNEFLVYPNPASDGVQIEWDADNLDQPTSLEFYDVAGKLIHVQKVSDNTNQEYIDFRHTNIQSGLYLLRIMSGTEPIEHKQIVVGQN